VAVFERGSELPTKGEPALAMVLVPTDGTGTSGGGSSGTADGTWVFPFDKPLPPAEGDNQALAVATKDGSVTYDLAFALVWADGDEVLNVNEAHAYASCSNCVAVAVAFQVVLIMDDAQVVVPQNLAVSANYDCYQCITAAIASQLVLSVEGEPGEEELRALGEIWGRLMELARAITSYSLTEITAQLESFKAEIVAILDDAPALEPGSGTSPAPTPGPGVTDSATPSPSPTPSASPADETGTPSGTEDGMGSSPTPDPTSPAATESAPSPPPPTETEEAPAPTPSP
jgi:putative peptide zinc metalloprotease protein